MLPAAGSHERRRHRRSHAAAVPHAGSATAAELTVDVLDNNLEVFIIDGY